MNQSKLVNLLSVCLWLAWFAGRFILSQSYWLILSALFVTYLAPRQVYSQPAVCWSSPDCWWYHGGSILHVLYTTQPVSEQYRHRQESSMWNIHWSHEDGRIVHMSKKQILPITRFLEISFYKYVFIWWRISNRTFYIYYKSCGIPTEIGKISKLPIVLFHWPKFTSSITSFIYIYNIISLYAFTFTNTFPKLTKKRKRIPL